MQSTTSVYQNDPSCPIEATDSVSFAQLELLYQLQRNILEDVALKEGYKSVLRKLCLMAEEMVPNSLASIMLLDDNGLLNVLAAPSIPKEGVNALNGLVPGPFGGSCGNTVYRKKPTFVCNILTDEKWQNLRALADSFGLGSCWSMPVRISEDEIIGTFALTSFEPSSPTVFQRRILDTCAYIVSIILRRHQSESKLEYLAYHDVLTGLPNRTYLQIAIEELILENEGFSLLMFGLDRFKIINDTHGHDIGDKVLVASANLLKSILYEGLRLFHISGDEFVLLVNKSAKDLSLDEICAKLKILYQTPIQVNELQFYLSGSMGLTYFDPDDPTSLYTLLKQADMAMYEAKRQGGKKMVHFEAEMAIKVEDSLALEGDIHHALENNEFEVYYQPILNTQTQKFSNLEALIRWNHPVKGVISPLSFISLMEDMGMIHELTEIVVESVLKDLSDWEKQGSDTLKVSINLSGREFNEAQIQSLLTPILVADRAQQIEFELTESYLMSHAEIVLTLLQSIRETGITLSIDDFGTGYSSLSYLKRFPIDKLKIDQSLVRDISDDNSDRAIVSAVVAMGHALGLKVVAEGVETIEHRKILEQQGVELLQGYLFSKPKPKNLVLETLAILTKDLEAYVK